MPLLHRYSKVGAPVTVSVMLPLLSLQQLTSLMLSYSVKFGTITSISADVAFLHPLVSIAVKTMVAFPGAIVVAVPDALSIVTIDELRLYQPPEFNGCVARTAVAFAQYGPVFVMVPASGNGFTYIGVFVFDAQKAAVIV